MDLLAQSLRHAFIDQRQLGHAQYDPELIINQPDENIFLLNTLQEELDTSETFTFSVAFVTESGPQYAENPPLWFTPTRDKRSVNHLELFGL